MIRLEIFANSVIREDIQEALRKTGLPPGFTWVPGAFGDGNSGFREGTEVWPDTNVMCILYLDKPFLDTVLMALRGIKERFPKEGMRCWMSEAERVI